MTRKWPTVGVFRDEASAQAVAGRLHVEGLPVEVYHAGPIPGLEEFHVRVPEHLVARAKSVMGAGEFTEAELTFLATGELGDSDGSS
jgi:hypothetical protein